MSAPHATPRAHRPASLSARASQIVSSSGRSSTGSLTIPPSASISGAYLHWPTAHLVRSRQVSRLANSSASGPFICTMCSTPTSHSVTRSSRCQYSSTGSSEVGRDVRVVVDVVRRAAGALRGLEERRAHIPGPEVQGRRIGDCNCVGGSGHGRAAPLLYLSSLGLNPALVSPISRWGVARRRRVRPIGPRKRRHLGAQSTS